VPDGYSADRERYNGGSTAHDGRQAGGYYQQGGCFPTGGGGCYEGGSPQADGWDRRSPPDFASRASMPRRLRHCPPLLQNDGRRDNGAVTRGGGLHGGGLQQPQQPRQYEISRLAALRKPETNIKRPRKWRFSNSARAYKVSPTTRRTILTSTA
jgi:hypothetical protein